MRVYEKQVIDNRWGVDLPRISEDGEATTITMAINSVINAEEKAQKA